MAKNTPLLSKPQTIADCHAYPEDEFAKLSLRQRLELYLEVVDMNIAVIPVVMFYTVAGLIWYGGYRYLVFDTTQEFWSDWNMRKFIIYNILHGMLGFGMTCGPLGAKFKVPFMANFLTALTPDSMCSPLFPAVAGIFQKTPGKRGPLAIVTFIMYFVSLLYCIQNPTPQRAQCCAICLFLMVVFDSVQFFSSKGDHYGYHMICMAFPDWIAGAQWVQMLLWILSGLYKFGPWFKYVPVCQIKYGIWQLCLPDRWLTRMFVKDWPHDFSISWLGHVFRHLGMVPEILLPLCCTQPPGTTLNIIGVVGMLVYHAFIVACLCFGSVFEWNYYSMVMTYFLFYKNSFALPTSPCLIVFIACACIVSPLVGQCFCPRLYPQIMKSSPMSGNFRTGLWVIKKTAKFKIDRIPMWNKLLPWEVLPARFGGERFQFLFLANFMITLPHFRGALHILETYFEECGTQSDEYYIIGSWITNNALFGWDTNLGWPWFREVFRTAVLESCGFEQGECLFFQMEPALTLPPHNVGFRLMDITKGPMDAECYVDEVPFSFLEQSHPLEVKFRPEMMNKGKSINGTFLTSYY